MKKVIFILIILLCTGCSANRMSYNKNNIDETDSDFLCLKNASIFAENGVGYAGGIPDELYAFGRLLKKENALDYFYALESEATNEGKLYALCGLYFLDYGNYHKLIKKYGSSQETVVYMRGCDGSKSKISEIIKQPNGESPVVRLKDNKDTYESWQKRNSSHGEYRIDFYGGGIPYFAKSNS